MTDMKNDKTNKSFCVISVIYNDGRTKNIVATCCDTKQLEELVDVLNERNKAVNERLGMTYRVDYIKVVDFDKVLAEAKMKIEYL